MTDPYFGNELNDIFYHGMKREIPEPVRPGERPWINMGCGNHLLPDFDNLDLPTWDAEIQWLRKYDDNSVGQIVAFHFFEHLTDPEFMLWECQRVLRPECPLTIVVPHYLGSMAVQDLDHKHLFSLETWKTTLSNPYYGKGMKGARWRFHIHINVIMGVVERNLALVTQLVKEY